MLCVVIFVWWWLWYDGVWINKTFIFDQEDAEIMIVTGVPNAERHAGSTNNKLLGTDIQEVLESEWMCDTVEVYTQSE